MALERIIKSHILGLEPYQPGKPIEELERELGIENSIKLASNESAIGPSPKAMAAVREALEGVHRYPDGASFALREKLSSQLGVDPGQLVFGAGADEILELLAKVLLGPGDEAIFAWPSFAMYPIVVQGMGATSIRVPLTGDLTHDLPKMSAAVTERTRLVLICNPNNPTGTSVGAEAFDRFAESLPDSVVLAIDEAYYEIVQRSDFPDSLEWIGRRPGTIALRTFSKIFGLAGLRIGFGIADPELAGYLQRARHPFNVSRLAEVAALAALDDDEHAERARSTNAEGIEYLRGELDGLGIETWPSDANFLLAKAGVDTAERLLRDGIIVRALDGFGMSDHIRISIGLPEENERLVKALRRLREGSL
jgi:histidinol-phosphate aminotransferase